MSYFPALERTFDVSGARGPPVLSTGYQTPATLRRIGESRLAAWLKNRQVRTAEAEAAVAAGRAQHTTVPGEQIAAAVVATLATEVLALNAQIAEADTGSASTSTAGHRATIRALGGRVVSRGGPQDGVPPSG